MALLLSGLFLVVVRFLFIVLLLLHLLSVVHLILPEALIQILVLAALAAVLSCALRRIAPRWSPATRYSVTPASGRVACVHFGKEEAEHRLTVRPVEVVELHGDLLLRLGRGLLTLVVFLREFAARLDQR